MSCRKVDAFLLTFFCQGMKEGIERKTLQEPLG